MNLGSPHHCLNSSSLRYRCLRHLAIGRTVGAATSLKLKTHPSLRSRQGHASLLDAASRIKYALDADHAGHRRCHLDRQNRYRLSAHRIHSDALHSQPTDIQAMASADRALPGVRPGRFSSLRPYYRRLLS